jgi:hypothetical protein
MQFLGRCSDLLSRESDRCSINLPSTVIDESLTFDKYADERSGFIKLKHFPSAFPVATPRKISGGDLWEIDLREL